MHAHLMAWFGVVGLWGIFVSSGGCGWQAEGRRDEEVRGGD